MRAMSLCSDEAENDQNEVKDLKMTMDRTNKEVASLTKQLQELQDQVGFCFSVAMTTGQGCHVVILASRHWHPVFFLNL